MGLYRNYIHLLSLDPFGLASLNVKGTFPSDFWTRERYNPASKTTTWTHNMNLSWSYSLTLKARFKTETNGITYLDGDPTPDFDWQGEINNDERLRDARGNMHSYVKRLWKANKTPINYDPELTGFRSDPSAPSLGPGCVECAILKYNLNVAFLHEGLDDELLKIFIGLLHVGRKLFAESLGDKWGIPAKAANEIYDNLIQGRLPQADNGFDVSIFNVLITCGDGEEFVQASNLPHHLDLNGEQGGVAAPTDHTKWYWKGSFTTVVTSTPTSRDAGIPLRKAVYRAPD